ncbi:hypothetical protein [Actinacidiphila sp. bgisy160]|uniref:hypothetical protein n=1 Tax=Actinacidiphila sp. bgisy160 TaxID=3413796 RepID=UPI003D71222A
MGPELEALAAAGSAAVVAAAGTDAWGTLRHAVARWFGRGDGGRQQAECERLEQTALLVGAESAHDEPARVRSRQIAFWQDRFRDVLERADGEERQRLAAELRDLLHEHAAARTVTGHVAAGRDITIQAEGGSVAASVIHGGVSISRPPAPDPSQG